MPQAIHLIYQQIVIPRQIKAAVDEAVKAVTEPMLAEVHRLHEEKERLKATPMEIMAKAAKKKKKSQKQS
jgi:hypothetical protein